MKGMFNSFIGAAVEETRIRNAQRGQCVYYSRGLCASECKPRCGEYAVGVCLSAGVCVTRRHYQTPPDIVREELLEVGV